MKVKRFIVIPLYDHTPDDEVADIMQQLHDMQFGIDPYVGASEELPASWPWEMVKPC